MKVKVLVENTSVSADFKSKHGLCLYIQTVKHKILFDLGSDALFFENALKMGVSIAEIDTLIISHGHVDHAGALGLFLKNNHSAKVYIRESAFDKHFTKVLGVPFNVGLDSSLKSNARVIFTKDYEIIDDELTLFSDVQAGELTSASNSALFAEIDGIKRVDDFRHEQNLLVFEGEKAVLFAGCAHAGIVNIKARAEALADGKPLKVIGGFHLCNPVTKKHERKELVQAVAERIDDGKTYYYTCHCTGQRAFRILKERLQDNLNYLATGADIEL